MHEMLDLLAADAPRKAEVVKLRYFLGCTVAETAAILGIACASAWLAGVSLACCFYGYKPDDKSQFFKDVAQNRGVRVEFFGERGAALRWLGVGPPPPV